MPQYPTIDTAQRSRAFHGLPDGRCRCYVRFLSAEVLFGLRRGAHNPACQMYRPSGDPLDHLADSEFRGQVEITAPQMFDVGTDASPLGGR